ARRRPRAGARCARAASAARSLGRCNTALSSFPRLHRGCDPAANGTQTTTKRRLNAVLASRDAVMPIEFRILGPLEMRANGRALPLGSRRQRAVLAVLLAYANETLSRERLIEELWADAPPASVDSAVHVSLSRLRRLLETAGAGGALVREPHGYRLAVEPGPLDASRFQSLAAEGSRARAARAAAAAGEQLPG